MAIFTLIEPVNVYVMKVIGCACLAFVGFGLEIIELVMLMSWNLEQVVINRGIRRIRRRLH
jgi:hypothetical protein